MRRLLFGVSSILLLVCSCMKNNDKEIKDVEELQESASLEMSDVHSQVTDSGFINYDFEAPNMLQYDNEEEPYIDFPNGLKFKMYSAQGTTIKSRIRCNNARYMKNAKVWILNNDVEAMTAKGEILNTEQLYWDTQQHRIYSEKFVKITTQHQVITGVGFESDEKLSKYEIKRPGGEIELENVKKD